MPAANRELVRAINRSNVLNAIRDHSPISRADIARLTGLSQATVTTLTANLINENLITETQVGDSTGGRPPILLTLNPDALYVVGIKLTEDHVSAALTNIQAQVIHSLSIPAPKVIRSVDDALLLIDKAVRRCVVAAQVPKQKVVGVGIGLAGVIDSQTGECRYSPFFQWKNVPFRDLAQQKLNLPVYVENDVNTLTMAEQWFGDGQGVENFLVITLGRGVGMGVVVNNDFYRGQHGGAGELGHIVIDPTGPICDCGKRGCLEAYVSDNALVSNARDALRDPELTLQDLIGRMATHDEALKAVFEKAGRILGMSLANLVNLFEPARIIITGEGTWPGDLLFSPMYEAMNQHVFNGLADELEIIVQEWGDEDWARGAASLVLRELYKSPIK